jgi:hypothetical protein
MSVVPRTPRSVVNPDVAEDVEVADPVSLLDQLEQHALGLVGEILIRPVRAPNPEAPLGDVASCRCESVQPGAD